ncbi:MAG: NTP transferase domain-containing protein [Nitrospiraceae bacterium]|jgi:mannose-1-phosphate guanylyltransferase|nr:MAG: NTP transferase domain-containing protein [Nitrospiraceae bacterium]
MKAVIQAGGKGTRLRPYSLVLPKPLMPVDELPVIEILAKWLRRNGIKDVFITTGYLGHLIRTVCGDGSQWGLKIIYSEEPEPLGTVGPLNLIRDYLDDTFLVLNGDLLTDLNLRAFTSYHHSHGGIVTVATIKKDINIDLGVIESNNGRIEGFREKPTMQFQVSMGVYCMEPSVVNLIPKGMPFGFDDLMFTMLDSSLPVYIYKHEGYWMDIGRPEDFRKAQKEIQFKQNSILGT